MDARANFAFGTLASGINSAALTCDVGAGEGARFAAVSFNAVIWNKTDYPDPAHAYWANEAEIVRVTNIATDTLTITRAQEGTTARNFNTGGKTYEIWAGPTDGYWDQLFANGEVMTTRGDLVRRGASNPERVAVGTFGQHFLSDGIDPSWNSPQNFITFFDDFLSSITSTIGGDQAWSISTASGVYSAGTGEAGRPGVVVFSTSTSASGRATISKAAASETFGDGKKVFTVAIKLSALSDGTDTYSVVLGWLDSATAPVDGLWFRYTHGENSGNWQGIASNNSVTTIQNGNPAGIAANTNWTKLMIVVAADGASAEFFVDGVSMGTVASNIPTSAGRETGMLVSILKSAGTGPRTMSVDYVLKQHKLTTGR